MPFNTLANSTVLDAVAANQYTAAQYNAVQNPATLDATLADLFAFGTTPATVSSLPAKEVTVGLVLNRASDPTALLGMSWAQRQAALADQSAVWSAYGADQATYNTVVGQVRALSGLDAAMNAAADAGYVSSAEDRTIWLTVNASQFATLFGQNLLWVQGTTVSKFQQVTQEVPAWAGNLGINTQIDFGAIGGVWIDQGGMVTHPAVMDEQGIALKPGPLSIANAPAGHAITATPMAIAANYNFPLPLNAPTDVVALVEENVGSGGQAALQPAYNAYRNALGLQDGQLQVVSTLPGGSISGELTLDISVIAGGAPNSAQLLYGKLNGSTPFNAYQRAIFDAVNDPGVISSSYGGGGEPTAQSPFKWAFNQLFVDAALANVSIHIAAGDQGASGNLFNGLANVTNALSPAFALIVGGTSIAGLSSALHDQTLDSLVSLALDDDPATVFALVQAGLRTLPSHLSATAPTPAQAATTITGMVEAVWNLLTVVAAGDRLGTPFGSNDAGSGGVATALSIPGYQALAGITSAVVGAAGRSVPDVAALAGGDALYAALSPNYVNGTGTSLFQSDDGTSAATPLWASLTAQFNAIFHDQGLPRLGYYNDLLYIASVIAPASFGDILLGNNINSFYTKDGDSRYLNTNLDLPMVPTGQGYAAGNGFDLATGLGTPNGTLLARTLTAIAHSQVSFSSSPALLEQDSQGHWHSDVGQTLLFQATSPGAGSLVDLDFGANVMGFTTAATAGLAWTSRLAQQSLQPNFDPGLAVLFDKQAQGGVTQAHLGDGQLLGVSIDGVGANALQAGASNAFGFADFFSGNNPFAAADALRVARTVAIAETVDGLSDQTAIVRLRQVGTDSLAVTLYRVDDLSGKIGALNPGDAGYAQVAQVRAYQVSSGGTAMGGPGYGAFQEAGLLHVNAGDKIAMMLTDNTTGATYWAFAQANETVAGHNVSHLWNYGLNTWGWEDTYGGGDHDYNDLIVQIDFTSAYGHGWLV